MNRQKTCTASRRGVKRLTMALCLMMALCLGFTGCGNKAKAPEQKEDSVVQAREVVDKAFQALKEGDYQEAQKYIPEMDSEVFEDGGDYSENGLFLAMLKQGLENMEYTIKDTKVSGEDSALVTVEVTNLDMDALASEYYNAMMDAILADEDSDGELSDQQLAELLKDMTEGLRKDGKTKTSQIQIKVEAGVFDLTTDTLDKMLGGLITAGEKMNE